MEGRGCCGISTALELTSRAVSAWSACTVERSVCDFGLYGVAGRLSSDSLAVSAQAVLPLAQEGTAMDVEEHGCREANLWPVAIAGRREARLRSKNAQEQVKSSQDNSRNALRLSPPVGRLCDEPPSTWGVGIGSCSCSPR